MLAKHVGLTDGLALKLHENDRSWAMPLADFRKVAAHWERLGLEPFVGQSELLAQPASKDTHLMRAVDKAVFQLEMDFGVLRFNFAGSDDI